MCQPAFRGLLPYSEYVPNPNESIQAPLQLPDPFPALWFWILPFRFILYPNALLNKVGRQGQL